MILPSDLVEEILCRVSFRSLGRFRSVCKQWRSLIVDQRFLKSKADQEQFIFSSQDEYKAASVVTRQNSNPSLKFQDLILRQSGVDCNIGVLEIVHCEGLLLYVKREQLMVWNPLLQQGRWTKFRSDFYDTYGLGYVTTPSSSCESCDYRIVRFRCACDSRYLRSRVEVYRLTSDTWKTINISFLDPPWWLRRRDPLSIVSLKGTPYWIGLRGKDTAFIQSFNFTKERFEPMCDDDLPFKPRALGIFKGDLLSALEGCNKTGKINIWVRNNSWSRLMTVAPQIPMIDDGKDYFLLDSSRYFVHKYGQLVLSCHTRGTSCIHIIGEDEFYTFEAGRFLVRCNFTPSPIHQLPAWF